jgi:hypothetical protein
MYCARRCRCATSARSASGDARRATCARHGMLPCQSKNLSDHGHLGLPCQQAPCASGIKPSPPSPPCTCLWQGPASSPPAVQLHRRQRTVKTLFCLLHHLFYNYPFSKGEVGSVERRARSGAHPPRPARPARLNRRPPWARRWSRMRGTAAPAPARAPWRSARLRGAAAARSTAAPPVLAIPPVLQQPQLNSRQRQVPDRCFVPCCIGHSAHAQPQWAGYMLQAP